MSNLNKRPTPERGGFEMIRFMGILYAAIAAIVIATAPMTSAQAAPMFAGSGNIVRDAVPATTESVRWGGRGRGFRGGGFRRGGFRGGYGRGYGRGYGYRRGYRAPVYFGAPVYYGAPAYYGRRCWIRPARWVWTPYGQVLRRAKRVCR
jgi:hypothetical protein